MLFLFGDYIENGPEDIQSTGFWKMVLGQCREFAAQYVKDGGDAKVVYLPDEGIKGNSHFMFQGKKIFQAMTLSGDYALDELFEWIAKIVSNHHTENN